MSATGAMRERIEAILALPKHQAVTFWIGVFKMGGHGDALVAYAFARAAKRHWQARLGSREGGVELCTTWGAESAAQATGERVGVLVLRRHTGPPADADIALMQRDIETTLSVPEVGWAHQAKHLAGCFDVFYDLRYTARAVFRDQERFAVEAAEARDRLDYWRGIHDFFPWSSQYLDSRVGLSQWELMSETAGFDVTPDDLFMATQTPDLPGYGTSPFPNLDAFNGCVTIHNGEGGKGRTKTLPRDVPKRIAEAVVAEGIQVVQVGVRDNAKEPVPQGAVDLRGLRITESAAIIAKARLHVDVEGGLVYVARAVGTPSVVFFGPTPPKVFGLYGNLNYTRAICPYRLDSAHCWWSTPGWAKKCPLGAKNCINLPQAETAAQLVVGALRSQTAPRIDPRPVGGGS